MTIGFRGYSFKAEMGEVHLVNLRDTRRPLLECRRCKRKLPEIKFQFIGNTDKAIVSRRLEHAVLHPWCSDCRTQDRGKWVRDPRYTIELDRAFVELHRKMRAGAKPRGLLVCVDKDDLLSMYFEQGGRCALTGMLMDWKQESFGHGLGRALLKPSVDRIHSDGNYTMSNIHLVCAIVNIMKGQLTIENFVELCRKVVEHNSQ